MAHPELAPDPSPASPWRWLPWLLFAAVWTAGLLSPVPEHLPGSLPLPEDRRLLGKPLHVAGYACFTALSGWLRLKRPWRWLLLAFLPFHAAATEFVQPYVGRTGAVADVGLDLVGVALGLYLTRKWWRA